MGKKEFHVLIKHYFLIEGKFGVINVIWTLHQAN